MLRYLQQIAAVKDNKIFNLNFKVVIAMGLTSYHSEQRS